MQTAFLKPRIIEVEPIGTNSAKIIMEPFERGFGHTLGNALRRVLLSSMEGFAPTEVQIAGVVHEYSTIEGVQEDVVDLLLNLKGVVFDLEGRNDVLISLRKQGGGVVKASDFDLPHDVKVINPDHVLAHVSDSTKLELQVRVENAADMYLAPCAHCPMRVPVQLVESYWMHRSRQFVVSATRWRAPASSSVRIWIGW